MSISFLWREKCEYWFLINGFLTKKSVWNSIMDNTELRDFLGTHQVDPISYRAPRRTTACSCHHWSVSALCTCVRRVHWGQSSLPPSSLPSCGRYPRPFRRNILPVLRLNPANLYRFLHPMFYFSSFVIYLIQNIGQYVLWFPIISIGKFARDEGNDKSGWG